MVLIRKSFLLFLCIIIANSLVFSQFKSKIHLIINGVHYENGMLKINYVISNAKENDKIRVWIDILNSKNDTIHAKSWQGDINKILSGEDEKTAIWNIYKDGIDFIDSVKIKISATVENQILP